MERWEIFTEDAENGRNDSKMKNNSIVNKN